MLYSCGVVFCFHRERQAVLLILGVADQESALLYPRKDALQQWLDHPESYCPAVQEIPEQLLTGVATLLSRASQKASAQQQQAQQQEEDGSNNNRHNNGTANQNARQGAIASAVSRALCILNRIMVATEAGGGISALHSTHYLQRTEDEGVVALMGNNNKRSKKSDSSHTNKSASWSPRILIVQASEDRPRDYNAMMNCAFCASQQKVVIDACFLKTDAPHRADSSPFLEQVCDLTNGVYLAPSGAAQVGGALTEVLVSVFLPGVECRPNLQLPGINKVDFRARCFETAEMVDLAWVCNQCLSIFATNPSTQQTEPQCPTCGARIRQSSAGATTTNLLKHK